MAHLQVEPRPKRPVWIWALLAIVLLALGWLLLRKLNAEYSDAQRAALADTTSKMDNSTVDWKSVDFYTGESTSAEISDTAIHIRTNEKYTIYTLGEDVLFASGASEISENGVAKLKLISELLQKKFKQAPVGIYGSTDSTGKIENNTELGKQRAQAVADWLKQDGGLELNQVAVRSLGENQPTATNKTEKGRQRNRNVSIVVFPKQ